MGNWIYLMPAVLVAATWWLPWEGLAAKLLGPLLLLISVGVWRLGGHDWLGAIYFCAGLILSLYAFFRKRKKTE